VLVAETFIAYEDAMMMKTAYRTAYGPPDVLTVREVPVPEPGPGQILVRVHAATVNRTDCGALWQAVRFPVRRRVAASA
jgi:NADPH:quinone reductase-like Zn-dependent oxidoreductase